MLAYSFGVNWTERQEEKEENSGSQSCRWIRPAAKNSIGSPIHIKFLQKYEQTEVTRYCNANFCYFEEGVANTHLRKKCCIFC